MTTVLLIDAESAHAEPTVRALEAAGYRVAHAQRGLDAIEFARGGAWDAAVVVSARDFDVHGLVMRLRSLAHAGLPILVADDAMVADRPLALAVGASEGIAADPSPSEVVELVRRALGGERLRDEGGTDTRLRAVSSRIVERLEEKERRLETLEVELRDHERRRSEFLRNVTHELATPLTPLLGYVELLRSGSLGALNASQKRVIEALGSSLAKLEHTTNLLQEVTAFERGEVSVRFVPTTLGDLAAAFDGIARSAPCEVTLRCESSDAEVMVDSRLMSRAIGRLIENSVKFGGDGTHVVIELRLDQESVHVRVVDDGPGIPPADLGRISELFHQVDGTATRRHGGLGLGLAYVRHVLAAHGGRIKVDRANGSQTHGTQVRLIWPRVR